MRALLLLLPLFVGSCKSYASAYIISPALAPQPSPQTAPEPLSPTATVKGKAKAKATPTPEPTPAPAFYVIPMQDLRKQSFIRKGGSRWEDINFRAAGLTATSQAWQARPYGDIAYLWHRQLAASKIFVDSGVAAPEPVGDEEGLRDAGVAGAKYLLSGKIEKLIIDKRGADDIIMTSFSGNDYVMQMTLRVKAVEVASGQVAYDKPWTYKRTFYDPTRMGSDDYKTFPGFFTVGLADAADKLTGDTNLRSLAGLPALTPTPTPTPTPLAVKGAATPTPGPTVEPTPDYSPYWVNPKTGKKVDPNWNFDPEDGTPRKDFIMRQPEAPKPKRATAPR